VSKRDRTGVRIYTKKGDDGTTGLLYGGRVAKDDLRTEVYGTLDETVAALGLARSAGLVNAVEAIVVRVQRELFVVGAELATSPENHAKLEPGTSRVTASMTEHAERDIDALLDEHPLAPEFVLPGETAGSAGLDLARSTVRRAERGAVRMQRAGLVPSAEVLKYLNRLSDLLFVLARYHEAERGVRAKPSRPDEDS
jgi:cob(I)alamin adenosyltransferase